jgi:hypothetical protein
MRWPSVAEGEERAVLEARETGGRHGGCGGMWLAAGGDCTRLGIKEKWAAGPSVVGS